MEKPLNSWENSKFSPNFSQKYKFSLVQITTSEIAQLLIMVQNNSLNTVQNNSLNTMSILLQIICYLSQQHSLPRHVRKSQACYSTHSLYNHFLRLFNLINDIPLTVL